MGALATFTSLPTNRVETFKDYGHSMLQLYRDDAFALSAVSYSASFDLHYAFNRQNQMIAFREATHRNKQSVQPYEKPHSS